jgi:Flp pilus assembly pilin Flp
MKKHQTGQGLAEVVLIAALVSVASVSALAFMAPTLSSKLNTMWGYFGAGGNSSTTVTTSLNQVSNSSISTEAIENSALNQTQVSSAHLPLGQIPTTIQAGGQMSSLYQALQNGSANLTEVSGSYGNMASASYALAEQIKAQAEAIKANEPAKAADLHDLAKQIKVLAGWQASVVTEIRSANAGGLFDSTGEAYELAVKAARETGVAINVLDANGNIDFFSPNNGKGGEPAGWGPADAAEVANRQAALVASKWQQIQASGSNATLNSADANTVTTAADNTVANGNVHTTLNAQNTFNNGQAIGNVARNNGG